MKKYLIVMMALVLVTSVSSAATTCININGNTVKNMGCMSLNTEGNKKALPIENVQANMKYEDAVSIVQHTPREYFVCVGDGDCTLVQGLCMGVAVNRRFSDKYKMAIAIFYKINNQAMSCPTDRQPAYSQAVCTHKQCSIIYEKSGQ